MPFNKDEFQTKLTVLLVSMSSTHTKGISVIETLLLPEEDRGLNESIIQNLSGALSSAQPDQQECIRSMIENLQSIREDVLSHADARAAVVIAKDELIENIATRGALASMASTGSGLQ